jgi:hypothetical protein
LWYKIILKVKAMKTQNLLKSVLLVVVLATTSLIAVANNNNETSFQVESSTDLKETIGRIVENDFKCTDNYLQQFNITEINDNVNLKFYIDSEKRIHVIAAESNNIQAAKYVEELLDNYILSADKSMLNRYFILGLKVVYRS